MNLLLELLEAIGLVTPAVERHVSDVGDDADDGSKKAPYRTIAHALADPAGLPAGQRLVLRLHGTLTESVTLPAHVTLRGPATLAASGTGPAVKIAGTSASHVTDVALSNLVLKGAGAYTDDGGAVLVSFADQVTLERCEMASSQAGRGGGLAILSSTGVTVRGCQVHDNSAGTPGTTLAGAGVGLTGITVPTGHGHGGGIFVCDSDAEIRGCDVYENQAILAGGGIAISNDAQPGATVQLIDCQVTCNQVSHPPLGALAAKVSIKRADVGDPVLDKFSGLITAIGGAISSSADVNKLVALLHGLNFESGLGGGISLRNTTASRISKCYVGATRAAVEGANRARRGAGISCYIGAYPTIEDSEIANNVAGIDGGGVGIDQFDPILPPPTTTQFGVSAIPIVVREWVSLNRNRIHDNSALEDGGGVYGSGNVQLAVKGGSVTGNRSGQDGGGMRATYASNLYAEGVTIANNQSNVVGTESDAGGGVSARNAAVTLKDCELTGNVANHFAGGAVYFASMWEGGIDSTLGIPFRVANRHSTFDQMMETAYGFHTRVLRLINCHGSGNTAQGDSGAGGFLYAVRSAEPASAGGILGGGEPMWVDIEGPGTDIGPNASQYTKSAMRKRGNVVIELSGTFDPATLVPLDRVWVGPDIPTGAIAQSTPSTPVPAQARALVVMLDRDSTHDFSKLTWDGVAYSFGAVPTVTGVTPTTASTAGGTGLTIAGTGLSDDNIAVLLGNTAATINSHTATSISVTSPAGPPGAADLTVISPSGARATLAAAVTLAAP